MAIPTSRAKEPAQISIDYDLCNGCGLCTEVCKDVSLILGNNKVKINTQPYFGCVGCGHCMAICPTSAIKITGRELTPFDLFDLPSTSAIAGYNSLMALLYRRRSIREFTDAEIGQSLIDAIINAAVTAPMGLPPSDVNILIINGKEKVRKLAVDFCHLLKKMNWLFSDWFITLMRPFWGKEMHEMACSFFKPMYNAYTESMQKGINNVTYDAPLCIYFYGSGYCDPGDPIIAATYAMLAGETLGLGTCMIGGIHPLIQFGPASSKFRKQYGIRNTSRGGLFVLFGYPAVKYQKGIRRTFASTTYY